MKKMIRCALLLLTMGTVFGTYGAVTRTGEVERIFPIDGGIKFRLKGDEQCNPNGKYYYFNLDSEVKKAWYSLLLAAANTSKPVRVSIDACPTDSHVPVRYVYQDF